MDLSFSRRGTFQPDALDLATLLARISAAQAATPTARTQLLLDRHRDPVGHGDARIKLFASPSASNAEPCGASFAAIFSPCQPK